jgi:glycosyltransferase involved in cell wall biosynthesis
MKSPGIHELPLAGTSRTGWPWTIGSPEAPPMMPNGNSWPRVSIVTPSFNQGKFLEETIRSVLLQGYPDLEYIIIDGGSSDGSLDIIRKYESWLAYWESTPDRGQAHAINKGWEKSRPGVWAWLNSDDLYLPGTVTASIAEIAKNPGTGIVYSSAAFIDEHGNLTKRMYDARRLEPGIERMKHWIRWPIPQPTVFVKSSLVKKHGPLDENYHYAMDYEWLVRLTRKERPLFIDEIRALYRIHDSSKTGGWEKTRTFFRDECRKANLKNATIYEKIFLAGHYRRLQEYPLSAAGNPLPLWRQQMVQDLLQSGRVVVHFSRFPTHAPLDGGIRRTIQLKDLLNELAPVTISCGDGDLKDEPLPAENTGGDSSLWAERFREEVATRHGYALRWAGALPSKIRADAAIVDDPVFFQPLVDRLKELGIPIIGLEQNIETIVPGQVEADHQITLLEKEIEYFKKCDIVITISHEDTVLLKNFGVNAVMYPYYPNRLLREPFDLIRKERIGSEKKDYLLLGSAYNVPTGAGMYELAKKWASSTAPEGSVLYVAGYGTETLLSLISAPDTHVRILGAIGHDELVKLLTVVKACIIYQEDGTGALTKIMELLIAGVPVLANHHAARTYHNMPGIYEFDDFTSLERILSSGKIDDGIAIPVPCEPDSTPVLRAVKSVLTGEQRGKGATAIYREELAMFRGGNSSSPAKPETVTSSPQPHPRDRIADDFASMYGNPIGRIILGPAYFLYKIYLKLIKKSLR